MRKNQAEKRIKIPDPFYNSLLVSRLINQVMQKGKKNLAQKIVYQTLTNLDKKKKEDALLFLTTAINNVAPELEIKTRKVGGARYQIPVRVNEERKVTLAIRWILEATKKRREKTFIEALTLEIAAAYKKTGGAIKKKLNIQKMAEANKAFAYYSW